MRGLRALLWVALLGFLAVAQAADAPRQPDGLLAVPTLARVTDLAAALSPADRHALEDKLAAFETTHGTQIAIVIVPSVQPEPIEDYAHRIGSAWKLGRAQVGDGLLIVVAVQDRRVRIDVMRALEGVVPDVLAKRIIREHMAPRFKVNDTAGGLNAGLDALFKVIEGGDLPPVAQANAPAGEGPVDAGLVAAVLPWLFVGVVVGRVLRRLFGVPGAMVAGGAIGIAAGSVLSSLLLGALAGGLTFVLAALLGSGIGRAVGGRHHGGPFIPGGGGWGGGGWGGGGGGGWTSGGGGDSAGGGASGDW